MDNFKFNFLSQGQFENLSLAKFFLTVFKIDNLIFALLLECFAEIILNWVFFCLTPQSNVLPWICEPLLNT